MQKGIQTARKPKRVVVVNRGKGGFFGWLKLFALFCLLLGVAGLVAGGVLFYNVKKELPSFNSVAEYRPLLGSMLYSEDGTKTAEFAIEKRLIVPYEKVPRLLILAFIATEDQNFFTHYGIDPLGIVRAAFRYFTAGFEKKQGASTITMQLARTFFLTREKTWVRKLKEVILATTEFEANLTKQEILWLYLNQIYLGHGAYGVQQAALTYFGKDVWDLGLDEMTVLAGLPQRPGKDSPYVNMDKAIKRRNHVLRRMLEEGYITQAQHDEAAAKPIKLAEVPDLFLSYAPDFSEHIRKYVYNAYGEAQLYTGGLLIQSTLNLDAEKYAQDALYYGLRSLDHRQGYRGPLANVPRDKWLEFTERLEAFYGDAPLERNKIYFGLVEEVDDARRKSFVRVGRYVAPIMMETMRWARKPTPKATWDGGSISLPSQALKPGDVVMVRPTDLERIYTQTDIRSTEPVELAKMIWALEQEPLAQSALLAKDPESGYTVAMVGGYGFERSEFNRAIQACRQPGSAFKPVVYTAAIDNGLTVSSILLDSPIVAGEWKWKWKPENYGEDFLGEVSLRYALQHSLNIPAIKTMEQVGIQTVKNYAIKMGVRTEIQEDLSVALGSACMTPEDLVNVYAHFPLLGRQPRTVYVKTIIDRDGNILEDNRIYYDITLDVAEKLEKLEEEALREDVQVLPETTAFIMTWLLQQVVHGGTGSQAAQLGRPCGGKTGTTNDNYDAWFVGFTPHLVAAAWIGHDDNSRPLGNLETGGKAALPIWLDFMQRTLENAPVEQFRTPEGIAYMLVDERTGRLARPGTPNTLGAPFKAGTGPAERLGEDGLSSPEDLSQITDLY
ncbi:MAG: PBP1A family penicillin-binding protein [Myxococcales bacterium]|nr:MAG: PBP1A family penicillin-binding protein [Myxococcales bacterium]